MLKLKAKLVRILVVCSLAATLGVPGTVTAATIVPVSTPTSSQQLECTAAQQQESNTCDLSITKLVSVNGGPYVDANTAATAATAHVGDTLTWKVVVSDTISVDRAYGTVYVKDVLPASVKDNGNYVASTGSYYGSSATANADEWVLPLATSKGATNLPATLTITTTADQIGTVVNTASLAFYDSCGGDCGSTVYAYEDANTGNNSDPAYVLVQTKPQVLGASTIKPSLTDTGTNLLATSAAAFGLIIAALFVIGYKPKQSSSSVA